MRDEAAAGGTTVLHVDDDPAFLDLSAVRLERADDEFTVRTETDPTAVVGRLADEPIDCVVSDYDMPRLGGLDLLREVRARHEQFPFLLFTGRGSEEIASEAIAAGVTDYLPKGGDAGRFDVLANRIEDAVAQRETRAALDESQRRFRTLVENLPGMAYRCYNEPDWPMAYASEGCARLTGYEPAALERGEVTFGDDIIHPEDRTSAWRKIQRAVDRDEGYQLTYRIERADGECRRVWEQGMPVAEDAGPFVLEGYITDFTPLYDRLDGGDIDGVSEFTAPGE